jgi:GxxExxY protein
MPLIYEEKKLDLGYRIDLYVGGKIIIEIKSVEALNPVHLAQLMTYLKLADCRIGFLINFNVASLKDGIRRVIIYICRFLSFRNICYKNVTFRQCRSLRVTP